MSSKPLKRIALDHSGNEGAGVGGQFQTTYLFTLTALPLHALNSFLPILNAKMLTPVFP
jgi:hypothetical protein